MQTKPEIEIDLDLVTQYSAQGMTNAEISDALGISEATFYNRKRDSEDFRAAIKKGKAMGVAVATNRLSQLIQSGNLGAICFFLKCKAGWKEANAIEMTSPDGTMSPQGLNVDLTGMTPEQLTDLARAAFTGK